MLNNCSNLGNWGESLVALWLKLGAYKIIERRYRCHFAEIDLIAVKKDLLLFVEVKSRSRSVALDQIIAHAQIKRIARAANYFVSRNPRFSNFNIRVDLFIVTKAIFIERVKNICSE